jgi:type III pantothenate kinase
VIASVVPKADKLFNNFENVVFINYKNIPKLKINLKAPEQVGADRIVNAMAAYQITKTSTLVIDSGTATTFCYVDNKGVYQGGDIIPGLELSSKALNDYTAKIPLIWVEPTQELFGKNTKEAVQIGIFKQAIFTINGFIKEYKKFDSKIKVVGTGKGLETLKDYLKLDLYDPELILKGLAICSDYE